LDPERFWQRLSGEVRELIVHCLMDEFSVEVTFAAVDEVDQIANAIGRVFDAAIETRPMGPAPDFNAQPLRVENLPPKAQVGGILSLFDSYNPDLFSLFSA
jgi:hypothetical protein